VLWQYPARTEPVPFTIPSIDGWTPSRTLPEARWAKAALYAVAAIAPAVFDDPWLLTQPEATSADKWTVSYPDATPRAHKRQPHLHPSLFEDLTQPEVTSVDKWFTQDVDFARGRNRQPHLQPATFDDLATLPVFVDRWYVQDIDAVAARPRLRTASQAATFDDPAPVAQPESTSPDKWTVAYPDRLHRLRFDTARQQAAVFDETPITPPVGGNDDRPIHVGTLRDLETSTVHVMIGGGF
jgi:hypothetical protein